MLPGPRFSARFHPVVSQNRDPTFLLDVGLPDIDGYEVARRIRANGMDGQVKLVAVTWYGQPNAERRAAETGFDLHLTKPVSPELRRHVLSRPLKNLYTSSRNPRIVVQ